MSHNILRTPAEAKRILLNKEIIAIDQDALGQAAREVKRMGDCRVYLRPLSGDRYALAVLNAGDNRTKINLPLSTVGLTGKYNLHDVWAHKSVARKAMKWSGNLQPHETKVFVLGIVK